MRVSHSVACLAVIATAVWAPAQAASAAAGLKLKESTYTNHNYAKCPGDPASTTGVVRKNCVGVAAIIVTWTKNGGSSGLWFGRTPLKEKFDLGPSYAPASTIEWRIGKSSGGRPVAAIVRYAVAKGGARTVVYRLEPSGASSCVMAILRDPGAAARARTIVDGGAEDFRCGSSKREES